MLCGLSTYTPISRRDELEGRPIHVPPKTTATIGFFTTSGRRMCSTSYFESEFDFFFFPYLFLFPLLSLASIRLSIIGFSYFLVYRWPICCIVLRTKSKKEEARNASLATLPAHHRFESKNFPPHQTGNPCLSPERSVTATGEQNRRNLTNRLMQSAWGVASFGWDRRMGPSIAHHPRSSYWRVRGRAAVSTRLATGLSSHDAAGRVPFNYRSTKSFTYISG